MLVRLVYVLFPLLLLASACAAEDSAMLLLDEQSGEEIVIVDGVAVRPENIYDALVDVIKDKGREAKVDLIFNPAVSFSAVTNVRGILQAVGFTNINIYYLGLDRGKMAELRFADETIDAPATVRASGR
jgi:hypothetical protein